MFRTCPSTFDESQMFLGDKEEASKLKVLEIALINFIEENNFCSGKLTNFMFLYCYENIVGPYSRRK